MFYTFEKCANPRVDWQVIWKKEFNDEKINNKEVNDKQR